MRNKQIAKVIDELYKHESEYELNRDRPLMIIISKTPQRMLEYKNVEKIAEKYGLAKTIWVLKLNPDNKDYILREVGFVEKD